MRAKVRAIRFSGQRYSDTEHTRSSQKVATGYCPGQVSITDMSKEHRELRLTKRLIGRLLWISMEQTLEASRLERH